MGSDDGVDGRSGGGGDYDGDKHGRDGGRDIDGQDSDRGGIWHDLQSSMPAQFNKPHKI